MNTKLIVFSALVTAAIGGAIGLVAAALFPCPYTSQLYQNLDRKYAIIGVVGGLLVGASQEMIRELKQESDLLEEAEREKAAFLHLDDRN